MSKFFDYPNNREHELEHLGITPNDFNFRDTYDPDDLTPMEVLVLTVYGEARGSSDTVIRYVTHVILNRISNRRSNVYDVAMDPVQFNAWADFDDAHKRNLSRILNPRQSTLVKVHGIVKDVVKRRAQGINPIPGVNNFTATRTLVLDRRNGRTFVKDVVPNTPVWPRGMEVIYNDDLAFLRSVSY